MRGTRTGVCRIWNGTVAEFLCVGSNRSLLPSVSWLAEGKSNSRNVRMIVTNLQPSVSWLTELNSRNVRRIVTNLLPSVRWLPHLIGILLGLGYQVLAGLVQYDAPD